MPEASDFHNCAIPLMKGTILGGHVNSLKQTIEMVAIQNFNEHA